MTVAAQAAGVAAGVVVLADSALLAAARPWDAAALTVTTAVGIINAFWLERVMLHVLQPGKPRVSRGAAAVGLGRLALWVLLFAALFAVRERVSIWAVVAGVACFLLSLSAAGMSRRWKNTGEE